MRIPFISPWSPAGALALGGCAYDDCMDLGYGYGYGGTAYGYG